MPSLFGRSKAKRDKAPQAATLPLATSKLVVSQDQPYGISEFGAVAQPSRSLPHRAAPPQTPPRSPPSHARHSAQEASPPAPPPPLKYSFSSTYIPQNARSENSMASLRYGDDEASRLKEYGFLAGLGKRVVLSVEDAGRVVQAVGKELGQRGLETPLLYSTQALELNQTRTKMLIEAYLESMTTGSSFGRTNRDAFFEQDIPYARPHELAWFLRWALSRVVRVNEVTGEELHGLFEWGAYEEWRGRERVFGYQPDAFNSLATLIPAEPFDQVLMPLFKLLWRQAAHSHLSGLTPHALSSLFAPALFDIPTSTPATHSHGVFVRAACATEHLLLSYIRWTGNPKALGTSDLPFRLQEWVAGYPNMIATDSELARGTPRKGARVVRCERATRTVRAYSKDLVRQAEVWANEAQWDAFERVKHRKADGSIDSLRYTTAHAKRLSVKEDQTSSAPQPRANGVGSVYGLAPAPSQANLRRRSHPDEPASLQSSTNSRQSASRPHASQNASQKDLSEDVKWGSRAGKEWSMFEEGGFDAPRPRSEQEEIAQRLKFDLNESAKHTIAERRKTMDWTDFASSSGGFNRTDPLLDISLTFSPPLLSEISEWPMHRQELSHRLQKSQKDAVPFHHDTSIHVGAQAFSETRADEKGRVVVEQAFIDFWADLAMGAGWCDRAEITFREANWVFMEWKAKGRHGSDATASDDPRTAEVCFLFEERVPMDYQLAVADPKVKKVLGVFGKKKKAQPLTPEQARTLARTSSHQESVDFDRMLFDRSATKKVTMARTGPIAQLWHTAPMAQSTTSVCTVRTPASPDRNIAPPKVKTLPERRITASFAVLRGEKLGLKSTSGEKAPETRIVSRKDSQDSIGGGSVFGDTKNLFFRAGQASRNAGTDRIVSPPRALESKMDKPVVGTGAVSGPREEDEQEQMSPPRPVPPPKDDSVKHAQTAHQPVRRAPERRVLEELHQEEIRFNSTASHPDDEDDDDDGYLAYDPRRHSLLSQHSVPSPLEDEVAEFLADKPVADKSGPPIPLGRPVSLSMPQRTAAALREEEDDRLEILSPSPQRHRPDTIANIVDNYRHSGAASPVSSVNSLSDVFLETDPNAAYRGDPNGTVASWKAQMAAATTSRYPFEAERRDVLSELLHPPAPPPIFDLTPGREPSPARYKHGEPLQFVGEEPDEDDYLSVRGSRLSYASR